VVSRADRGRVTIGPRQSTGRSQASCCGVPLGRGVQAVITGGYLQ
jgi:hypothetical protein